LGGIIISILGILGIYLGKTFDEAKKRPLYLVRNSTNSLNKQIGQTNGKNIDYNSNLKPQVPQ
jgi:dolichol-phosphate mannosyltransferase